MLDVRSGQYFNLDPIGSRIWNFLTGPIEVETLCRALAEQFDAPQQVIESDVLALMDELAAKNLIIVDM
ncbi:MAG: PqqD family protein [Niveispirillum sp.]|nr:PqqD family protein [Niveispirillum sp.]